MSRFQSGIGMTLTYGGWEPVDEAVQTECPYCHGNDTEFLGYADEARNTEKYVCHDCKAEFEAEIEIPF